MTVVINGSTSIDTVQDGVVTDTKLNLTANSAEIKEALNASNGAPIYACRAWVNFNGTGTVAIRASGNVSSITDNAGGDFTVNFTTALVDTNYCINAWARGDATTNIVYGYVSSTSTGTKTTSAVRIISGMQQDGITYRSADSAEIGVSVFR